MRKILETIWTGAALLMNSGDITFFNRREVTVSGSTPNTFFCTAIVYSETVTFGDIEDPTSYYNVYMTAPNTKYCSKDYKEELFNPITALTGEITNGTCNGTVAMGLADVPFWGDIQSHKADEYGSWCDGYAVVAAAGSNLTIDTNFTRCFLEKLKKITGPYNDKINDCTKKLIIGLGAGGGGIILIGLAVLVYKCCPQKSVKKRIPGTEDILIPVNQATRLSQAQKDDLFPKDAVRYSVFYSHVTLVYPAKPKTPHYCRPHMLTLLCPISCF